MSKTLVWSGVIAAVVAVVISVVSPTPKQIIREVPGLGAVVSSESLSSPVCSDGLCTHYKRMAFVSPTTTPCALRSPNATTTIERATVNVTTGSSTAATLSLATSTTAFATTTNLATYTLTASTQNTYSFTAAAGTGIVPPLTFLVLGAAGGPANGHQLTGTCSVEFRQAN